MIQDIKPRVDREHALAETLENKRDFIIYGNTKNGTKAGVIASEQVAPEDILMVVDQLMESFRRQ